MTQSKKPMIGQQKFADNQVCDDNDNEKVLLARSFSSSSLSPSESSCSDGKKTKPEATANPSTSCNSSHSPRHDGNPPWHAVAFIGGLFALLVQHRLSQHQFSTSDDDENNPNNSMSNSINHNNPDFLSHVLFPTILPLPVVIGIRLTVALVIFADVFRAFCLVEYLGHRTTYYPGTQLKAGAPIEYRGILTRQGTLASGLLGVVSFTMVTWILEGICFGLAALVPLMEMIMKQQEEQYDNEVIQSLIPKLVPWLVETTITLWQIVAPTALLITLVVTYVLWPFAIAADKAHGTTGNVGLLDRPGPLLAHNLNTMAVITELTLLGGLPLSLQCAYLAPLYGCLYVLFSWFVMKNLWLPQLTKQEQKDWGPQYIYPFMDTTLGWQTTLSLIGLLLVLTVSHGAMYGMQQTLHWMSPQHYFHNDSDREGFVDVLVNMMSKRVVESDNENLVVGLRLSLHCGVILLMGKVVCRFRP